MRIIQVFLYLAVLKFILFKQKYSRLDFDNPSVIIKAFTTTTPGVSKLILNFAFVAQKK